METNFVIDLNNHWLITKEWFNQINENGPIFPNKIKKISQNDKSIFSIKFLYLLKKIFDIDDLDKIDKIRLKNYDICKLYENLKNNQELVKSLVENDNEMKIHFTYILQFKNYFSLIEKKLKSIMDPIFTDENFRKMFKYDDDLTRVLAPIAGTIFYLYLSTKDIEETIKLCLEIDIIFIQFFIVSYLIIDNFMDDNTIDENVITKHNKKIFMKWFINIVCNPDHKIVLDEKMEQIWQFVSFKKYFELFVNKYPVETNKNIYEYVKHMIYILQKANKEQKKKDITEDEILEHTFKKSYVVSFFMTLFIKLPIEESNIFNLCKLLFLIQLYDDYFDIDKDNLEGNITYFNNNIDFNNNFNNNFNDKIKKLVIATFIFAEDLNEKNKNMYNIILFFTKNFILLAFYNHIDKTDSKLVDYFCEYSILSENIINYFDKNSYSQFNNSYALELISKYYV